MPVIGPKHGGRDKVAATEARQLARQLATAPMPIDVDMRIAELVDVLAQVLYAAVLRPVGVEELLEQQAIEIRFVWRSAALQALATLETNGALEPEVAGQLAKLRERGLVMGKEANGDSLERLQRRIALARLYAEVGPWETTAEAVSDVLELLRSEPGLYRPFRLVASVTCECCGYVHDASRPGERLGELRGCTVLVRDESKRSERPFTLQAARCNVCGAWLNPHTNTWERA